MNRREESDKVDFKEICYDYLNWIQLRSDRDRYRPFVIAVMKLNVP